MIKRRSLNKDEKADILRRGGMVCANCGRDLRPVGKLVPNFDHIIPLGEGGPDTVANMQVFCADCNLHKGDKFNPQAARQMGSVEYVPIDSIQAAPWNPPVRKARLSALAASIAQIGLKEPLMIGRGEDGQQNVLADGNRRWVAAKIVGLKVVPVIKHEDRAAILFLHCNSHSRKLGPKEWGQMVADGRFPSDATPEKYQMAFQEITDSVGDGMARSLLKRFSPRILAAANTVAFRLEKLGPKDTVKKWYFEWINSGGTTRNIEAASDLYSKEPSPKLLKNLGMALKQKQQITVAGALVGPLTPKEEQNDKD